MKKAISVFILSFFVQVSLAQRIYDEIKVNPRISAGNYLAYPDCDSIKYTHAPNGYSPFHIEHYGRHGSRRLTDIKQYTQPIETLEKAEKHGFLTRKGKETLEKLKIVYSASKNRLGELTPLGAEQHKGIAKRMYRNFPNVFTDNAHIDARSTVVIRCILSMSTACLQLKAMNPFLNITQDASNADMFYMNYYDEFYKTQHDSARTYFKQLTADEINHTEFINRLVSNSRFACDSIDGLATMEHIFDVASNMQSHDFDFNFYDLFSVDELYAFWERWNKFWYIGYGNSAEYGHIHPYIQKNLFLNIINSADNAIRTGTNGAKLRFGHEICILPLAVLMELNDCNKQVSDLKELAKEWYAHEIFPMASNIQIIFYRNKNNHILIKVLLNEKETRLPIKSDIAPYYDWNDIRSYYIKKLQ